MLSKVFDLGTSMASFPPTVTDEELIAFVDRWAELLEREDYEGAFALSGHIPEQGWTPDLIRHVIKDYGGEQAGVTASGVPTDFVQRRRVDRWPQNKRGSVGGIWYDLYIDGKASDLTATFELIQTGDAVTVCLDDIHVM